MYVDSSALYAVLVAGDSAHEEAGRLWAEALGSGEDLVTTNYVLLETQALLQRRLGMAAVRVFEHDVVPSLQVQWVDQALHDLATVAVLAANRRDLSLVDCVSFEVMRRLAISRAFAFDQDFVDQGFDCLP